MDLGQALPEVPLPRGVVEREPNISALKSGACGSLGPDRPTHTNQTRNHRGFGRSETPKLPPKKAEGDEHDLGGLWTPPRDAWPAGGDPILESPEFSPLHPTNYWESRALHDPLLGSDPRGRAREAGYTYTQDMNP